MARHLIPCNNCGGTRHQRLLTARGNRGVSFISKSHPVVICSECGLVFLNPQHDEEDYKRFYSDLNVTAIDTKSVLRQVAHDPGREEVRDFLFRVLRNEGAASSGRLLDIGCGYGVFLSLLKHTGWKLEGLEPGSVSVAFARRELGLEVHEWVLNDNTLPRESFDVVTMLAVIEHVNDPLATIKKIAELIRPGGYLLLTTPSIKQQVLSRGIGNYYKFVHTYYFSETTLSSIMKQAGFEITATHIKKPATDRDVGVLFVIGKKTGVAASYGKDDVGELKALFRGLRRQTFAKRSWFMLRSYLRAAKSKLLHI